MTSPYYVSRLEARTGFAASAWFLSTIAGIAYQQTLSYIINSELNVDTQITIDLQLKSD